MKRALLVVPLCLLATSPALALTFIGPPVTYLDGGQLALDGSYGDSRQDIKVGDVEVRDMKWWTALGALHYGLLNDRLEIFGRLGAVQMQANGVRLPTDFAAGAGFKVSVPIEHGWSWGLTGQFLWWRHDLNDSPTDRINMVDAQIVFGPAYRAEPLLIYGGPMVHLVRGNTGPSGMSMDITERDVLGGYIGGGLDIWEHLTATAEFEFTPSAYGWAAGLQWRF
jgi:hypothetical protein